MAETPAVSLCAMTDEYVDDTYYWLQDIDLRESVDCSEPPTIDGNLRCWQDRHANPTRQDFAVLDENGRHIGNCGLSNVDLQRKKAELWLYLGEKTGNGYGRLVVEALLQKGFRDQGLHRLYLRVLANNKRAIKLYQNLGFEFEGCLRHDTWLRGVPLDVHVYSLLEKEYMNGMEVE